MIPFDFDYYRPDTIQEAVDIYRLLDSKGKEPLYYSGGSEIISMARANNVHTKAIVDLKSVPECNVLEFRGDSLIIGSCITLSNITESKMFPLLGKVSGRIADHTMQCKITIGGNIASTIIYRETVLPLLLADGIALITNGNQIKKLYVKDIFNKRLHIYKGDFLLQFIIEKKYTLMPYVHVKKTKNEKIDYPLISISALKKDENIRIAMSGVCDYPFRSTTVEDYLNNNTISYEERVANVIENLPSPILSDLLGSADYKKYVLKNTLLNTLQALEV